MNGVEHYREAERLVTNAELLVTSANNDVTEVMAAELIEAARVTAEIAHVHATLAIAAPRLPLRPENPDPREALRNLPPPRQTIYPSV